MRHRRARWILRCFFAGNEAGKEQTKATMRCIPLEQTGGRGKWVFSGKRTDAEVPFAQAHRGRGRRQVL